MLHYAKKIAGFSALTSFLIFCVNCAQLDEPKNELQKSETEEIKTPPERPIHLSVDAMVVADPALVAAPTPIPIDPIAGPIAGPFIPPLPPLPPPMPMPAPFLYETRFVPPHQASIISGRGQLPSRHGNRTFLYSFEIDADAVHHHHHHHRH